MPPVNIYDEAVKTGRKTQDSKNLSADDVEKDVSVAPYGPFQSARKPKWGGVVAPTRRSFGMQVDLILPKTEEQKQEERKKHVQRLIIMVLLAGIGLAVLLLVSLAAVIAA